MQGTVLLVICVLLLTVVIAKPFNKHPLKGKTVKQTALGKKVHSKLVAVKSNADVFKFLTQFGYNRCVNSADSKRNGLPCRSSLPSMLGDFQTAFHMPVTRVADAATLKLMNTPRCGLPDSPSSLMDRSKLW
jgi:hypothetical protein